MFSLFELKLLREAFKTEFYDSPTFIFVFQQHFLAYFSRFSINFSLVMPLLNTSSIRILALSNPN